MVTPKQQVGNQVDLGGWAVTEEFLHEYLKAVGDDTPAYFRHGLAPPVALAARALGLLLERMDLPPGAIHSLQEIEALAPVPVHQTVSGTATVGPPKRRGGMEFINAGFTLEDEGGREVLRGRSGVIVIDPAHSPGPDDGSRSREGRTRIDAATESPVENAANDAKTLPKVSKTIDQEQLRAYSQASGDWNSLHLDAEFAASTKFGGIIAHGMLTLAFISEMMTVAFDRAWLEAGSLRVRFKGAAYLGDRVEARGRVEKEGPHPTGNKLECAVAVVNRLSGQELVSGTAGVTTWAP